VKKKTYPFHPSVVGPFMRRRNKVKSDTLETYICGWRIWIWIRFRNRIQIRNWFAFQPNDSDAGRIQDSRRLASCISHGFMQAIRTALPFHFGLDGRGYHSDRLAFSF